MIWNYGRIFMTILKLLQKFFLPTQPEVGRANKYIAEAFLAKTILWMAYPQNDKHQVTGIDASKLTEALGYIDDIINSGKFSLASDFAT